MGPKPWRELCESLEKGVAVLHKSFCKILGVSFFGWHVTSEDVGGVVVRSFWRCVDLSVNLQPLVFGTVPPHVRSTRNPWPRTQVHFDSCSKCGPAFIRKSDPSVTTARWRDVFKIHFFVPVPVCCSRTLWENFVQPIDQTVLQGVDRSGCHWARERVEEVRRAEVEVAGNQATMTAHETWPLRMKMTLFKETQKTMRTEPGSGRGATRETMFACFKMRVVRCSAHTSTVAYKGIAVASQRNPSKKTSNCAHCSFRSVDDHQVFGEDELHRVAEQGVSVDGHSTSTNCGVTRSRIRFPCILDCCRGLWRVCKPGRSVDLATSFLSFRFDVTNPPHCFGTVWSRLHWSDWSLSI